MKICRVCGEEFIPYKAQRNCSPECTAKSKATYRATPHYRWMQYRANARHRGLAFDMSEEEFTELVLGSCEYCGESLETLGVDRIDSGKGYVEGNCVPCCTLCNRLKSDLPQDVWMNHMEKIMEYKNE